MSTVPPPSASAILNAPGGATGPLRTLVDRLAAGGVAVAIVDEAEEAAVLAARRAGPPPCVLVTMARTSAEPEDLALARRRLEDLTTRLPGLTPVVVTLQAAPLFLIACLRAGAGDVIDLTLEGTSAARVVVARVHAAQAAAIGAAGRERSLRSIVDEFLRDLIRTERRSIDLEERLARRERRSTGEILASVDPDPNRQPTVLLIEDDRTVADAVAEALEQVGVSSYAYLSGEDTLAELDRQAAAGTGPYFDLALVDLRLPGIDGLDTIRQLRTRLPELPAFLITGFAEPDIAVSAADLGVSGFVYKPFNDLDQLVRRLRDLATASMTRHRESLYLMRIKERHERVLLHYRQLAGDLDSLAPAASSPPRQP